MKSFKNTLSKNKEKIDSIQTDEKYLNIDHTNITTYSWKVIEASVNLDNTNLCLKSFTNFPNKIKGNIKIWHSLKRKWYKTSAFHSHFTSIGEAILLKMQVDQRIEWKILPWFEKLNRIIWLKDENNLITNYLKIWKTKFNISLLLDKHIKYINKNIWNY